MDSLRDWYRYVDSVSRKARGEGEPPPRSVTWRPWREMPASASAPGESVRPADIPDLGPLIGSRRESDSLRPDLRSYRDLTVDDKLAPPPEFPTLSLKAPRFELPLPQFPGKGGEERATPSEPLDVSAATTARAAAEDVRPAEEPRPAGRPRRRRDMDRQEFVARIREEAALNAGNRVGPRGSREELLHRLLDPELSLEQASTLLGVCPATIRRYTNRGILPHTRTPGNQRRFRLSDVLEFIESREEELDAGRDAEAGAENTG